jgi:CrcB protein
MFRNAACVAVGGCVGAVIRESIIAVFDLTNLDIVRFPIPTILVNAIGAFLLGFFSENLSKTRPWYPMLGTGFCGGLTTFSTFCAEIHEMIHRKFDIEAAIYIIVSIAAGVSLAFLGTCIHLPVKQTTQDGGLSGTSETGKEAQDKGAVELDPTPTMELRMGTPLIIPN